MIAATVIPEPQLEFGSGGRQIEQRRGILLHGPADVASDDRRSELRVGIVGPASHVGELANWLRSCSRGVDAKSSASTDLFPPFPGCTPTLGFLTELKLPKHAQRSLSRRRLRPISDAGSDAEKVRAAVAICASETRLIHDRESVDVVMVIRPDGVPQGVPTDGPTGGDFHDLLKAAVADVRNPVQIIRPATWKGGAGVEDQATCAWNLFTALYYKAGGKPWRLARDHSEPTRCYVGVSFTATEEGDELMTSVAQVFNELGDGVVVRGGLAQRSAEDRQPHLSSSDATSLLESALARYRQEHRTIPAAITLHKSSSFSDEEVEGFHRARDEERLSECELVWLTNSEGVRLSRGSAYHPPLRGTLISLNEDEHALYTHGSIPFYKTYPGLYVPSPLGIRPVASDRDVSEIAAEVLALTKLNWNRARLDGRQPITLLTANRVGQILRHVPADSDPPSRYANYM